MGSGAGETIKRHSDQTTSEFDSQKVYLATIISPIMLCSELFVFEHKSMYTRKYCTLRFEFSRKHVDSHLAK